MQEAPLARFNTENSYEIIEGLYLGNYSSVKNSTAEVIVNCTKDLPFPKQDKICIRLPIDDTMEESEFVSFVDQAPRIIEQIHGYIESKKKVLVHCLAGQQRSCAVVALYLMYKHHMSILDAVQYIQERKKDAFFYNINFLPALLELDRN